MSTDYIAYAQSYYTNENGEKCVIAMGPYVPHLGTGEFKCVPVVETCSWFREAWDLLVSKLPHRSGLPNPIAPAIYEHFKFSDEDNHYFGTEENYYGQCMRVFKFSDVAPLVKRDRPYTYQGYVLRQQMVEYDTGQIDEIEYWLTQKEYDELDDDEKKSYTYFEWNGYFDAYSGIVLLVNNMRALLDAWDNAYGCEYSYSQRDEIQVNAEIILYVSY